MKNYPKISIITPVKNNAATIEKTIQSVIAQNYPNLEYIIIDGASTDGTIEIIKKYQNNINYWHSKPDGGAVGGTVEGLKIATGEIVAFINADDFYEKDVLFKIAEEFSKDPSLDLVSMCYRVLKADSQGNLKIIDESNVERMELEKNKIIISYGINARFFKKNIFKKYGMMLVKDNKDRVFVSNDIEHLIRILLKGIKNKTLDFVGYTYLAHERSNTFASDNQTKERLWEDKIFIAQKFLNSKEFDLPKIWEKTFKKWLLKYRAYLVANQLKSFKFKASKENICAGIKENNFFKFSFYLLKTLFRKL